MRLQVVAVGRLKAGPERDLAERYRARAGALARGLGFSGPDLVELSESRSRRPNDRMAAEAAMLSERIGTAAPAVLDERAPSCTSEAFAERLAGFRDSGAPALGFVIGGPDGLSPEWRGGGAWGVSFGRLTLPHGLVRVLLLEQLYRAFTIMAGHPYHRGGADSG